MVDIRPFRGIRYDSAKAGDLCDFIAGPYDVISPEKQEELYQRHSHNVVRLELGKELPSDTPQENRYTRAATTLQQWLREGVLLRDKVQSFYLDRHQFSLGGKELVRWGLLAAVSLEDLNRRQILPHEKTTEKPKQDRLELLKGCHTSFSPIMALYSDPKRQVASLLASVEEQPPIYSFQCDGETHTLWRISRGRIIGQIRAAFAPRKLYIADGHHRLETAQRYRELQGVSEDGKEESQAYNFTLMMLVDVEDPGLTVLPYHRLIRRYALSMPEEVGELLKKRFEMQEAPLGKGSPAKIAAQVARLVNRTNVTPLGFYGLKRGVLGLGFWQVEPRPGLRDKLPSYMAHQGVVLPLLGVAEGEAEASGRLAFIHDAEEAIRRVDAQEYGIAIFLPPTPLPLLMQMADAGEHLPPKSTYFYPKAAAGLVCYSLTGTL